MTHEIAELRSRRWPLRESGANVNIYPSMQVAYWSGFNCLALGTQRAVISKQTLA